MRPVMKYLLGRQLLLFNCICIIMISWFLPLTLQTVLSGIKGITEDMVMKEKTGLSRSLGRTPLRLKRETAREGGRR